MYKSPLRWKLSFRFLIYKNIVSLKKNTRYKTYIQNIFSDKIDIAFWPELWSILNWIRCVHTNSSRLASTLNRIQWRLQVYYITIYPSHRSQILIIFSLNLNMHSTYHDIEIVVKFYSIQILPITWCASMAGCILHTRVSLHFLGVRDATHISNTGKIFDHRIETGSWNSRCSEFSSEFHSQTFIFSKNCSVITQIINEYGNNVLVYDLRIKMILNMYYYLNALYFNNV